MTSIVAYGNGGNDGVCHQYGGNNVALNAWQLCGNNVNNGGIAK